MFNWTCAFLVVYFYPMADRAINKYVCYFFFAAVCLLGGIFIKVVVPETKGKTEEDMKKYFLKEELSSNDNKGFQS